VTPLLFFLTTPRHPRSSLCPYTTLFRSLPVRLLGEVLHRGLAVDTREPETREQLGAAAFEVRDRLPVHPREIARRQRVERGAVRSEEHTSELQSREKLVCRLLLE